MPTHYFITHIQVAAGPDDDTTAVEAYQPFHAARADLLARAGRVDDARLAYERAIELTTNATEREFLVGRRERCATARG